MDIYEMLRLEARSKKAGEPLKEQYTRLEIDLSEAREDEAFYVQGDYLSVAYFDGNSKNTYIKLNHRHSRHIYPGELDNLKGSFGGLYISNDAEPGKKLVLYVGRGIFFVSSIINKLKSTRKTLTTYLSVNATDATSILTPTSGKALTLLGFNVTISKEASTGCTGSLSLYTGSYEYLFILDVYADGIGNNQHYFASQSNISKELAVDETITLRNHIWTGGGDTYARAVVYYQED